MKLKRAGLYISYILLPLSALRFSWHYCFEEKDSMMDEILMSFEGIALFLFSFSLILLVKDILAAARTEQEVRTLKQKNTLEQAHARELASLRTAAAAFQEEMQARLASISTSIARQEYEEAEAAFADFQKRFHELPYRSYCGDGLLNTILLQKEQAAAQAGIRSSFHILLPGSLKLDPVTVTSLFTNLLDNGIEACMVSRTSDPFLELTVKYENSRLLIQLINTKNPAVRFQGTSTKENASEHGFGLKLIEEITDKADGSCEWRDEGERFVSIVMLQM